MTRILGVLFVASMLMLAAAPAGAQAPAAPGAAKAAGPAAAINLNTATVAQLQELPGIGARTAERIVEYREKNGGFKKIEELMNVKGIGEKSFLKIKPLVSVPAKAEKTSGD